MVPRFLVVILLYSTCNQRAMAQSPIPIDFEEIPAYSSAVFVGTGFADDYARVLRKLVAIELPSD